MGISARNFDFTAIVLDAWTDTTRVLMWRGSFSRLSDGYSSWLMPVILEKKCIGFAVPITDAHQMEFRYIAMMFFLGQTRCRDERAGNATKWSARINDFTLILILTKVKSSTYVQLFSPTKTHILQTNFWCVYTFPETQMTAAINARTTFSNTLCALHAWQKTK